MRLKYIVLNLFPDKLYLRLMYRKRTHRSLHLHAPVTFSEKLQWLKLNDRRQKYTTMVDKYAVKEYAADKIGSRYIIPTLGVWDRFEDIDFESLPEQFVLKCTHDSGGIVICRDKSKLDKPAIREKIEASLKKNYYYSGREWPYKNVPPRIIAEQYLENPDESDLRDYKFFCFNGEPMYCQVISERNADETIDFFDMEWNHLEFTGLTFPYKPNSKHPIPMPVTFTQMRNAARVLAKDIPFLRVDFYEVKGNMYFGELTFYPASGFGEFSPQEWNYKLGDMIPLTAEKRK